MLSDEECMERLRTERVGRTAAGTKFHGAVRSSRVAFEIDGFDQDTRTGWSVIVRGRADEVLRSADRIRLAELELHPWAASERDICLVIRPEVVTGRKVSPQQDIRDGSPRGRHDPRSGPGN